MSADSDVIARSYGKRRRRRKAQKQQKCIMLFA